MRPCFCRARQLLSSVAMPTIQEVDNLRECAADLRATELECLNSLAISAYVWPDTLGDTSLELARTRSLLRNVQARARMVESALAYAANQNRNRRTA